jgi:hypothetical protein
VFAPPDLSVLRKAKVFCPVLSPLPDSEHVEPVRLCCFYTEYKLLGSLLLLRGGVLDYSHERLNVVYSLLPEAGWGQSACTFRPKRPDLMYLKSTRLFTCQSWSDRVLARYSYIRHCQKVSLLARKMTKNQLSRWHQPPLRIYSRFASSTKTGHPHPPALKHAQFYFLFRRKDAQNYFLLNKRQ